MKTRTSKSTRVQCAAQHFGMWWVDPAWHQQMLASVKSGLFKPQVEEADRPPLAYEVIDGVAVIPVDGMLTKGKSSFGGTSMMELAALIRTANRDPTVEQLMLEIDSPGGTYSGFEAVAYALKSIAKPSTAKVSDWAASGGLLVAVHCDQILVNKTGQVGSIGCYTVLLDTSKADEEMGLTWTLITSGGLKGAGADGRITPELIADYQKDVDRITREFVQMVAEQRGLAVEAVQALADGRMFNATEALNLGLVDRVIDEMDVETFLEQENAMAAKPNKKTLATGQGAPKVAEGDPAVWPEPADVREGVAYGPTGDEYAGTLIVADDQAAATDETAVAKPATLGELKTEFAEDKDFILERAEVSAPMVEHKAAYADRLKTQVAALKTDLATAKPRTAGQKPIDVAAPKSPLEGEDSTKSVVTSVVAKRSQSRYGHHAPATAAK